MVFDGRAHLIDLTPARDATDDEAILGPPTVTLRNSIEVAPEPETPVEEESHPPAEHITIRAPFYPDDERTIASAALKPAAPAQQEPAETDATADETVVPFAWHEGKPRRKPALQWALGVIFVVLLLLLAGQALFHFRDAIAANYPQFRPYLVSACASLGCSIDPLRNRDEITIESHDMQADPAHQGLLILQVTLRNRALHPVAFPHLELEILDSGGQPQVRRAFAPVEYAGGAADFTRGMPANAEWNVKLFLDASSISARGYNLDLYYP